MPKITKEQADEIDAAWQAATMTERLRLPRVSWFSVGNADTDYFEEKPTRLELAAADRIAELEEALITAARRFDLLALADNGLRNGVIPSVGASECRAALAESDRQHKRPGSDSGP